MNRIVQKLREFFGRHPVLWTAAGIAILYFLIQCTQISQYGVTWDEPLHRNWGKLFAYFWKTGDRRFIDAMPGYGMYYGPLYYLVQYLLSEWIYAHDLLRFVAANHIVNLAVASAGVGLTYILGHLVGGRKTGLLAALFLVCFPQFIAHSHYNPKDLPLMVLILITAILFLLALRRESWRWLLAAAFVCGVSIAFKVSAVLMIPALVLTYVVYALRKRKQHQWTWMQLCAREWKVVLLSVVLCVFGLVVAWPTVWGDLSLVPRAIRFFGTGDFWPGKVLYFGTEYGGAALPWYYITLEYLFAMPLLWMFCMFVGFAALLLHVYRRRNSWTAFFFIMLWIVVPLLASMKPGLVRYDGMRQFYFVLPGLAVAAALGFEVIAQALGRFVRSMWSSFLLFGILIISVGYEVAVIHPYEGSYRNEFVRFLYPKDLDHAFQIEYWGASYKQGMEWLIEHADPNPVICVPTAGILVAWYPWREDFAFECSEQSSYIMFFTRYSEAQQYALMKEAPVYIIERYNSVLLKIYKMK